MAHAISATINFDHRENSTSDNALLNWFSAFLGQLFSTYAAIFSVTEYHQSTSPRWRSSSLLFKLIEPKTESRWESNSSVTDHITRSHMWQSCVWNIYRGRESSWGKEKSRAEIYAGMRSTLNVKWCSKLMVLPSTCLFQAIWESKFSVHILKERVRVWGRGGGEWGSITVLLPWHPTLSPLPDPPLFRNLYSFFSKLYALLYCVCKYATIIQVRFITISPIRWHLATLGIFYCRVFPFISQ